MTVKHLTSKQKPAPSLSPLVHDSAQHGRELPYSDDESLWVQSMAVSKSPFAANSALSSLCVAGYASFLLCFVSIVVCQSWAGVWKSFCTRCSFLSSPLYYFVLGCKFIYIYYSMGFLFSA